MPTSVLPYAWFFSAIAACSLAASAQDPAADREGIEFFEKKIRPVLVEHCYECHSSKAKQLEGSLSLESRDGARKGGDQGPAVVPNDVEMSLLIKAIRYSDDDLQMPPKQRLPDATIADFESWIKRGAPDPRVEPASAGAGKYSVDIEAAKREWPYTPPVPAPVPAVKDTAWPRTEIDYFILAKLEDRGLSPAPDADPRTLIRRVTYDLTGLPPTPVEVNEFLTDAIRNPQSAIRSLTERLLASPAYGERWGRHWLDVVRYADTAGDNSDYPIPQMYKYRNWVIGAINDDMPYDEFMRQQLAGDLLPAASTETRYQQIVATGYLANARRFGSRVSDYPQHLTIEDTIDNLGRAFLGMSLSCARCHNHKFDPITADDYYALYGIFHSTRYPWPGIELEKKQRDLVPLADDAIVAAATAERKKQDETVAAELKACDELKKAGDALAKAAADRLQALKQQETPAEQLAEAEKEIEATKKQAADLDKRAKAAKKKKTDLDNTPLPFNTAYAVAEAKKIEDCKIHIKGDPERLGAEAPRHFPTVLGGQRLAVTATSGRRELADWIASKENPLTARVMVNRLWHHHFGRGIVATPNDFGKQGKPPTHKELLDYLALRFIDSGWSLKAMHRLIVTSRAYQMASEESSKFRVQSSKSDTTLNFEPGTLNSATADPANDLLWRFNRRRLDAESIRDTLLVLGGNLDRSMGGPHPFPPQPEWDFTQHKPFKAVYDSDCRSVYLMMQRIQRHPLMAIFDGPDTSASTASRTSSTTTLQALYFLNDPHVHEQAARLAARLLASRSDDEARIRLAYELCFSRQPTGDESVLAQQYLASISQSSPADSTKENDRQAAAWQSFVRVLLRSNEFVYVD